jgi:hypothetical protein
VEIVHILRAKKKALSKFRFEFRQGNMGRIRTGLGSLLTPLGVELPHQFRLCFKGLRSTYILHAVPSPQPV